MEAQAIVFDPFAVCSLFNRKFIICLFVDEETNGSYLITNRLNRLAHLSVRHTQHSTADPMLRSSSAGFASHSLSSVGWHCG
jgi:hypothetical protein